MMKTIIKKILIYIALAACIKTEQASAQITTQDACSLAVLMLGSGFVSHKVYKKIIKSVTSDKEQKQHEQSKTKKSARGIKKYLTPSILLPVSITALAGIGFVSSSTKGSGTTEKIVDPTTSTSSSTPPPPPPAPAPSTPKIPYAQTKEKAQEKAAHLNIEKNTVLSQEQLQAIYTDRSENIMKVLITNVLTQEQKNAYDAFAEAKKTASKSTLETAPKPSDAPKPINACNSAE